MMLTRGLVTDVGLAAGILPVRAGGAVAGLGKLMGLE